MAWGGVSAEEKLMHLQGLIEIQEASDVVKSVSYSQHNRPLRE